MHTMMMYAKPIKYCKAINLQNKINKFLFKKKTIFSPSCTEWSSGSAWLYNWSRSNDEPFLPQYPGRDLAEKLAFGRQTHQWLSKSRSQFRSQGGSAEPLGFSGDDGEVWGKKTIEGERFLHWVCHMDALCMASLLHGQWWVRVKVSLLSFRQIGK